MNNNLNAIVNFHQKIQPKWSVLNRLLFALLAVPLATGAQALGRAVTYEELPFSTVTQVISCGEWRHDDESGMFRVLLAYHSGQNMLFVDMVKPNASQTQLVVHRGFAIDEFDNDHADYDLSGLRCRPAGEGKIRITGRSEDSGGEKGKFRIDFDGRSGTYIFRR